MSWYAQKLKDFYLTALRKRNAINYYIWIVESVSYTVNNKG